MEHNLTKTQKKIFDAISKVKGMTPKEIQEKIGRTPRTIRNGLNKLITLGLVKRVPCLHIDMRTCQYFLI